MILNWLKTKSGFIAYKKPVVFFPTNLYAIYVNRGTTEKSAGYFFSLPV
jgi:hypothetical protein